MPQITVIVTFPAFFAFRTPVFLLIVAIFLLDTVHCIFSFVLFLLAFMMYFLPAINFFLAFVVIFTFAFFRTDFTFDLFVGVGVSVGAPLGFAPAIAFGVTVGTGVILGVPFPDYSLQPVQ